MQEYGKRLLSVYVAVTLGLGVALLAVVLVHGRAGFSMFQVPGHGSSLAVNFVVFCLCWLLLGGLLVLTQYLELARRHALFVGAFTLMAFAYLNVVREPHEIAIGDFGAYFHAAECIRRGVPIEQSPDRLYLYPPLLATVLSPLVPLGIEDSAKAFRLLNYLALVLFMPLLYGALLRYRFTPESAAIALFCALAANVPIVRTIIYGQINLHTENLILLSFLLFARSPVLSALCLSLAVHLKISPVVLALPFLLAREWRWCGAFIVWHVVIVVMTALANGPHYYLEFLQQSAVLHETALRNVSIDAFMYNSFRLGGLGGGALQPVLVNVVRLCLGAAILRTYWRLTDRHAFTREEGSRLVVANGYAVLPLFMLAVSPSIWEHHFVFLILPMLALLPALGAPRDLCLYGLAYLFIFLFPVYDIYPVSYLRLVAIILLLVLYGGIAKRSDDEEDSAFAGFERRLASFRA